jgi:hypothetical protein
MFAELMTPPGERKPLPVQMHLSLLFSSSALDFVFFFFEHLHFLIATDFKYRMTNRTIVEGTTNSEPT